MYLRKTLIVGLALAIAVAFSPLPELQAATFVNPSSQPGTDSLIQQVKKKKKSYRKAGKKKMGKRKHRKGKRARKGRNR